MTKASEEFAAPRITACRLSRKYPVMRLSAVTALIDPAARTRPRCFSVTFLHAPRILRGGGFYVRILPVATLPAGRPGSRRRRSGGRPARSPGPAEKGCGNLDP